jgi:hypothetical protein
MDLQLIAEGNPYSPIASSRNASRFKFLALSRRFLRIFAIASLPLYAVPSLAYTFPFDPSAPSILKTPPTGTVFDTAARNQMFLSETFEGYNTSGGSYTSASTPWVVGQDVIVSDIPFVEGEVYWDSELKTWVNNGMRYFTGNGVPNHPTGAFPLASGQEAYQYYAALPDPSGEYPDASQIPIDEYDLYMAVPANPIYSNTPRSISE